MRTFMFSFAAVLVFAAPTLLVAGPIVDFEGLSDGTILTNQYAGLTFSNATIFTAGISLNEFEFPPFSGFNVASDTGGPMAISFASPVVAFSGYFTHLVPLTLRAFNSASVQVAVVPSLFSDNLALSGDPGSHPNEFLQLAFTGGFSRVEITGDLAGGSFVFDDASVGPAAGAVPEPSGFFLVVCGLFALLAFRRLSGAGGVGSPATRRGASLIAAAVLAFLVLPGIGSAAQQLPAPSSSRTTIPVGQPTSVTITTRIVVAPSDPVLIPSSINLVRQDVSGRSLAVQGVMQDDGTSTNTFKITFQVNETTPGQLRFVVSAAFRGVLARSTSLPLLIPLYAVNATTSTSVPPTGGIVQIPNVATLTVAPGTFSIPSLLELTSVNSPILDSLAPELGQQIQPIPGVTRLQLKSSELPVSAMQLQIMAPNLIASIPAGSDVRVFALAKQVGDFGEQMDTLVGIGGTLCANGNAVCVTILPDHFFEENPFLTQFIVAIYTPSTGGTVQFWNIQNVQPAPGNLDIMPTDVVSVRANVTIQSPFATGSPVIGSVGPLSHFGLRCVDPNNNYKPVSLLNFPPGPLCAPGLIVRQHKGVDFQVSSGTPVSTPISGRTDFSRFGMKTPPGFEGFRVWLTHDAPDSTGFSMETAYFHLQCGSLGVATPLQGTVIGLSDGTGPSGCATPSYGPHLHFETTLNGIHIDPEPLYNGNVSLFLPYNLRLEIQADTGKTTLSDQVVNVVNYPFQFDVVGSTIISACGGNPCNMTLSAVSDKLGVQLLRRWTITAVRKDITVTLLREVISQCSGLLFSSNRTVVASISQQQASAATALAVRLNPFGVTNGAGPYNVEAIDQGVTLSSVSYNFNAGRDPACNTLPITTRYTVTQAVLAPSTVLNLSGVPPQQLVLSVTR